MPGQVIECTSLKYVINAMMDRSTRLSMLLYFDILYVLQWEFQVGPAVGISAGDELWVARYILEVI